MHDIYIPSYIHNDSQQFSCVTDFLSCSVQDYERFRGVTNGRLVEIHRALSELLPTARALGSSPKRTNCLSCDQRVRSNGDVLNALGTGATGEGSLLREQLARAAAPQALPRTAPVGGRKPISAIDPIGVASSKFCKEIVSLLCTNAGLQCLCVLYWATGRDATVSVALDTA